MEPALQVANHVHRRLKKIDKVSHFNSYNQHGGNTNFAIFAGDRDGTA